MTASDNNEAAVQHLHTALPLMVAGHCRLQLCILFPIPREAAK
jgi:hypothetical protein